MTDLLVYEQSSYASLNRIEPLTPPVPTFWPFDADHDDAKGQKSLESGGRSILRFIPKNIFITNIYINISLDSQGLFPIYDRPSAYRLPILSLVIS